jgi:uncharacterized protein (DUF1697 family)
MALVVFLRGVNVGGHKRFRPSLLARELKQYDVVNIGAAGTFVVRRPGSRTRFRAALLRSLPFATEVVVCDGHDLVRLATDHPFGREPASPEVVRFVTILARPGAAPTALPVVFPKEGPWLVRLIAARDQFVLGLYRRHMKTIGYLDQAGRLFRGPATTRNWNTIMAIVSILQGGAKNAP